MGLQPFTNTPSDYGTFIQSEIQKFARIVKSAGVKAN